jgi:GntR family transcriptional regulator, frlABCD operon transcriptional regulator
MTPIHQRRVDAMAVEYDNLTPLYDQVRRLLLRDIKEGRFQRGSYLPSEPDLCERYGVSRITLRRAVHDLSAEGYLKRMHGRGTLVTEPKVEQTLVSLSGFTESLTSSGHKVRYAVLDNAIQASSNDVQERLKAAGDDRLVGIRRLLLVDDRPMTLEELYFLGSRYGRVAEPVSKGGSFNEALKALYGEEPKAAERAINVDFPSAAECELLACTASQPVYRIEKLVLSKRRTPISFSVLTTPCDRVTYSISS